MKNDHRIYDERLISESNKIYKKCYIIFCAFVLIDLIIKLNMSSFITKKSNYLWILFGLETLFLIITFYFNLLSHAHKGILIGASDLPNNKFQYKRYSIISSVIALIISVGLWGSRLIIYSSFGLNGDVPISIIIITIVVLSLITFIIIFSILFLSFFISYKIAEKINKTEL